MQQTTPDSGVVYSVLDAISDYGWHAVILVGVLYFAWNKYVKPSLSSVTSSSSSSPAINGDDSRAPSLEEMRRARAARLQSEYDRKAAEEAEVRARKEKEAEEKKAEEERKKAEADKDAGGEDEDDHGHDHGHDHKHDHDEL